MDSNDRKLHAALYKLGKENPNLREALYPILKSAEKKEASLAFGKDLFNSMVDPRKMSGVRAKSSDQAYKALRQASVAIIKELQPDPNTATAMNKLANLVNNADRMDEGMINNQIGKIADLMGIRMIGY